MLRSDHQKLVIPIELYSREFDAKLLLGCLAAEQGWKVTLGEKLAIHLQLHKINNCIYIAKDFFIHRIKILRLAESFGWRFAGWDEEAIVYYSPDLYRKRRIDPESLAYFNMIFAWGNDNKKNLEPVNHHHVPIEVTGNPRADLLRPEFNTFFLPEIDNILHQHGDFILFNSNFGSVNPENNMRKRLPLPSDKLLLSKSAEKNYDPELAIYRHRLLDHFVKLIPILAQQLPQFKIIVRPHPAEGYDLWLNIAQHHS
ncbi:MAG: hypothetical protein JNK86_06365, partial [Alphaproteobacteria bacterium]|nr:hypothetical protein [Alphaproteobacteria bacterium]